MWSLLFRRDVASDLAQVRALVAALQGGTEVVTTGLVLQELLQGFSGPKSRQLILSRFSALPLLQPDRQDHVAAADLRNTCRRSGLQVATIDALLARLCIRHRLTLLTTDGDFRGIAKHAELDLWQAF